MWLIHCGMCVPGMESCLWGAVHRPLPPAGTDEENCRHKGQRNVTVTFDAPLRFVLHVWSRSDCILIDSVFIPCWRPQFIVKDSVEERMVEIQRKKQDLLEKAFGSSSGDRKTSRINDIKALLELSDVWGRVWFREADSLWHFELLRWGVSDLCVAHQLLTFFCLFPILFLTHFFSTSRLCTERGDKQLGGPNRGVNLVVEQYCLQSNAIKAKILTQRVYSVKIYVHIYFIYLLKIWPSQYLQLNHSFLPHYTVVLTTCVIKCLILTILILSIEFLIDK